MGGENKRERESIDVRLPLASHRRHGPNLSSCVQKIRWRGGCEWRCRRAQVRGGHTNWYGTELQFRSLFLFLFLFHPPSCTHPVACRDIAVSTPPRPSLSRRVRMGTRVRSFLRVPSLVYKCSFTQAPLVCRFPRVRVRVRFRLHLQPGPNLPSISYSSP
jgi:hypothetical protein